MKIDEYYDYLQKALERLPFGDQQAFLIENLHKLGVENIRPYLNDFGFEIVDNKKLNQCYKVVDSDGELIKAFISTSEDNREAAALYIFRNKKLLDWEIVKL